MKLNASQCRATCDPQSFNCSSVKELTPLESIIGQPRAVKALLTGLGIQSDGFNIYVSGEPGTGKLTSINHFLKELAKERPDPQDWCYVNNFKDPYHPKKLALPKGQAQTFKALMKELVEEAKDALIRSFESEDYESKRRHITDAMDAQHQQLVAEINQKANEEDIVIQQTSTGFVALPIKEGKILDDETFNSLKDAEKNQIRARQENIAQELENMLKKMRKLEKSTNEQIKQLNHEVAHYAINLLIEELEEKYQDLPEVYNYLESVQTDILENLSLFLSAKKAKSTKLLNSKESEDLFTRKYSVNVLVDHTTSQGAPVVLERNPTYHNLFGKIEKESEFGTFVTDFTLIREGSIHKANGGFLIIPADELLRNLFSWDSLKMALRNKEIPIEDIGDRLGLISAKSLKPEAIPLNLKIIIYGSNYLYHLLLHYDNDFKELFKIKADFDVVMPFTKENLSDYAAFVCKICDEEQLVPLDGSALAKIIELGSRFAEHQQKISIRFGEIADVIREASFYAKQQHRDIVTHHEIKRAIDEKIYRSNLLQEKIIELMHEKTLRINIEGSKIGQINGLAVLDLGNLQFGRPSRISCNIGIGKKGIISIEREAELSGNIHTKGVMILSGFLLEKFAQHSPLNIAATLVFEQSYSEIDGDSASSAELYTILSSLADVPLRQDIAVTGSVDQKGDIQAVGGINEKIEGYYEVCKIAGLSGHQGVMIPTANIPHLMLKEEVVSAIEQNQFHIYAIDTIEEGLELLTGMQAGTKSPMGEYAENSLYARISNRLQHFTENSSGE